MPPLDKSMKAGNDSHPEGAAAVKEIYENAKLKGWAVSVKTQADSDNGKGWYWYEVVSPTDASQICRRRSRFGLVCGLPLSRQGLCLDRLSVAVTSITAVEYPGSASLP